MAESESRTPLETRFNEIYEQEQKLAELRRSKGPFDRAVRALTTNTREGYERLILENVADQTEPIEGQLWRLHHHFIEEFRARLGKLKAAAEAAATHVPHKKKAVELQKFERVGGQYKCFLDEASGFYHGLLAKLGKLSDAPTTSIADERFKKTDCVSHRCYVCLGDLARYKELHLVVEGRTADYYVAANYYRQAAAVWPFGGHPHNQLGILANYAVDSLQALYHFLHSLAVPVPFVTARPNAKILFEKNQQYSSQLSNSPEEDVAIDIQMAQGFESHVTKSSTESHRECPLARLQRRFRVHFITLLGVFFSRTGLEEISELSTPVLREAQLLLSQDNMLITSSFTLEKSNPFKNQAFSVMQLVVLLILSIHNAGPKKERRRSSEGPEISPFVLQAITFAFQFIIVIVQHCTRTEEPCCSHLFPAVVVFCRWLGSYPDLVQQIQADEDCDKHLCSFGKEAFVLLPKCLQQVSSTKNHDYDCIPLSEKEGHHGIETVLWEDKELYGIVALKYSEMKTPAMAKTTPDSACVVRVARLTKALTFLSSVFKMDSSELDVIGSVTKSSFGWASLRASPSEKIRSSQSSGGSIRTGDGSMELRTQAPCILKRSFEISLSSHCRKEDRNFLRKLDFAGPSNLSKPPSDVPHQLETVTGGELRASQGTACRQPESNLETILEEPASNLEGIGRGTLSLGDWVRAAEDNGDAAPVLKKRKSIPRTHSSGEESLNPSLSFKAPKPPRPPSCSNEAGEPRENTDTPGFCKSTDTRQGSAQDPIDLDEEPRELKLLLSSSQSRKRKHSPDVSVPPSEENEQTPVPEKFNTTDAQSVQTPPREEHHVIVDGADAPQRMDRGLEGCSAVQAGRGKKRKPEAVTPTTLCHNCQGTASPGEGDSEKLTVVSGWRRAPKRPRMKESMESEEDYSWLDTYTHVVPQALTKLAAAMSKASFSFSDFGIFFELGAT